MVASSTQLGLLASRHARIWPLRKGRKTRGVRLTFDQVVYNFRMTVADLCLVPGNDLFLPLEQRVAEGASLLGQVSSL